MITTDGCTGFPDKIGDIDFAACCTIHDAGGSELGFHQFSGWDGSAYGRAAYVLVRSTEAFTTGAHGATYAIVTTTGGTTTEVIRLLIGPGVQVGSPSGGDKGAGTLNAKAVYDDNTLLTCYPFDAYLDGTIDDAKWDAKVPDRQIEAVYEHRETDTGKKDKQGEPITRHERVLVEEARTEPRRHEDMRKFKARLGTDTDPLDLDKYIAHWREKRHLTSLPNEVTFDPVKGLPTGSWIQRLIETVEIQAIHISQLHERLKVLESKLKV